MGGQQRPCHFPRTRLRLRENKDLNEVTDGNGCDEQQNDGLDGAHPKTLQGQEQQHVQAGDDDRPEQRDVKQQIEGDGAAGTNGHFAHQPVGPARPARVPVAAALGKILPCHDAQPRRDDLHEDGHQAGQTNHPKQAIFELSAGLQICPPVAGIHVADTD